MESTTTTRRRRRVRRGHNVGRKNQNDADDISLKERFDSLLKDAQNYIMFGNSRGGEGEVLVREEQQEENSTAVAVAPAAMEVDQDDGPPQPRQAAAAAAGAMDDGDNDPQPRQEVDHHNIDDGDNGPQPQLPERRHHHVLPDNLRTSLADILMEIRLDSAKKRRYIQQNGYFNRHGTPPVTTVVPEIDCVKADWCLAYSEILGKDQEYNNENDDNDVNNVELLVRKSIFQSLREILLLQEKEEEEYISSTIMELVVGKCKTIMPNEDIDILDFPIILYQAVRADDNDDRNNNNKTKVKRPRLSYYPNNGAATTVIKEYSDIDDRMRTCYVYVRCKLVLDLLQKTNNITYQIIRQPESNVLDLTILLEQEFYFAMYGVVIRMSAAYDTGISFFIFDLYLKQLRAKAEASALSKNSNNDNIPRMMDDTNNNNNKMLPTLTWDDVFLALFGKKNTKNALVFITTITPYSYYTVVACIVEHLLMDGPPGLDNHQDHTRLIRNCREIIDTRRASVVYLDDLPAGGGDDDTQSTSPTPPPPAATEDDAQQQQPIGRRRRWQDPPPPAGQKDVEEPSGRDRLLMAVYPLRIDLKLMVRYEGRTTEAFGFASNMENRWRKDKALSEQAIYLSYEQIFVDLASIDDLVIRPDRLSGMFVPYAGKIAVDCFVQRLHVLSKQAYNCEHLEADVKLYLWKGARQMLMYLLFCKYAKSHSIPEHYRKLVDLPNPVPNDLKEWDKENDRAEQFIKEKLVLPQSFQPQDGTDPAAGFDGFSHPFVRAMFILENGPIPRPPPEEASAALLASESTTTPSSSKQQGRQGEQHSLVVVDGDVFEDAREVESIDGDEDEAINVAANVETMGSEPNADTANLGGGAIDEIVIVDSSESEIEEEEEDEEEEQVNEEEGSAVAEVVYDSPPKHEVSRPAEAQDRPVEHLEHLDYGDDDVEVSEPHDPYHYSEQDDSDQTMSSEDDDDDDDDGDDDGDGDDGAQHSPSQGEIVDLQYSSETEEEDVNVDTSESSSRASDGDMVDTRAAQGGYYPVAQSLQRESEGEDSGSESSMDDAGHSPPLEGSGEEYHGDAVIAGVSEVGNAVPLVAAGPAQEAHGKRKIGYTSQVERGYDAEESQDGGGTEEEIDERRNETASPVAVPVAAASGTSASQPMEDVVLQGESRSPELQNSVVEETKIDDSSQVERGYEPEDSQDGGGTEEENGDHRIEPTSSPLVNPVTDAARNNEDVKGLMPTFGPPALKNNQEEAKTEGTSQVEPGYEAKESQDGGGTEEEVDEGHHKETASPRVGLVEAAREGDAGSSMVTMTQDGIGLPASQEIQQQEKTEDGSQVERGYEPEDSQDGGNSEDGTNARQIASPVIDPAASSSGSGMRHQIEAAERDEEAKTEESSQIEHGYDAEDSQDGGGTEEEFDERQKESVEKPTGDPAELEVVQGDEPNALDAREVASVPPVSATTLLPVDEGYEPDHTDIENKPTKKVKRADPLENSGYDAEASQCGTEEEEVSEAVNTEDEEDKREESKESAEGNKPTPIDRTGSQTLSDMDAADERTPEPDVYGAEEESSELEDTTKEVGTDDVQPRGANFSAQGSLVNVAMSVQRLYSPEDSSNSEQLAGQGIREVRAPTEQQPATTAPIAQGVGDDVAVLTEAAQPIERGNEEVNDSSQDDYVIAPTEGQPATTATNAHGVGDEVAVPTEAAQPIKRGDKEVNDSCQDDHDVASQGVGDDVAVPTEAAQPVDAAEKAQPVERGNDEVNDSGQDDHDVASSVASPDRTKDRSEGMSHGTPVSTRTGREIVIRQGHYRSPSTIGFHSRASSALPSPSNLNHPYMAEHATSEIAATPAAATATGTAEGHERPSTDADARDEHADRRDAQLPGDGSPKDVKASVEAPATGDALHEPAREARPTSDGTEAGHGSEVEAVFDSKQADNQSPARSDRSLAKESDRATTVQGNIDMDPTPIRRSTRRSQKSSRYDSAKYETPPLYRKDPGSATKASDAGEDDDDRGEEPSELPKTRKQRQRRGAATTDDESAVSKSSVSKRSAGSKREAKADEGSRIEQKRATRRSTRSGSVADSEEESREPSEVPKTRKQRQRRGVTTTDDESSVSKRGGGSRGKAKAAGMDEDDGSNVQQRATRRSKRSGSVLDSEEESKETSEPPKLRRSQRHWGDTTDEEASVSKGGSGSRAAAKAMDTDEEEEGSSRKPTARRSTRAAKSGQASDGELSAPRRTRQSRAVDESSTASNTSAARKTSKRTSATASAQSESPSVATSRRTRATASQASAQSESPSVATSRRTRASASQASVASSKPSVASSRRTRASASQASVASSKPSVASSRRTRATASIQDESPSVASSRRTRATASPSVASSKRSLTASIPRTCSQRKPPIHPGTATKKESDSVVSATSKRKTKDGDDSSAASSKRSKTGRSKGGSAPNTPSGDDSSTTSSARRRSARLQPKTEK